MSQKVTWFIFTLFIIIIIIIIIDPNCTIIFTEPKPAHNDLLKKIIGEAQISGTTQQPSCYQLDDEAMENQNDNKTNNNNNDD